MKRIVFRNQWAILLLTNSFEPTNVDYKAPYWNRAFHGTNKEMPFAIVI